MSNDVEKKSGCLGMLMELLGTMMCAIVASLLGLSSRAAAADNAQPQPIELLGIENAFRVTGRILAGSQPKFDVSFEALAKAGVKTIISVDGSRPDVGEAKKHGMRYVHLPFGYDGIPANRIAELTKAAGPDAGTIFVHCHHGLHRGPAAVGVICEATAGWTPAQAEAWLKQAGTAADYPGLYRAVREFRAPTPEEIAPVGALPEAVKPPALVDTMVALDEHLDRLKDQQRAGWRSVPENPDALPGHQATLLWEQLRELARTDDTAKRPEDFRKLLAASERATAALRTTLRTYPANGAPLDRALRETTQSCTACHKVYRNEK
jgi:protein tyrosine phosphatase (PTP) superfamily phosphohydrolase (DUF442 family)